MGFVIFSPQIPMPNHVYNTVTVSGDKTIVELLETAVEAGEQQLFDFNRIIPMPAVVDLVCDSGLSWDVQRANPNRNWYDWCNQNWGTKWNAYEIEKRATGVYWFATAWPPPLPVMRTLSTLFPELVIEIDYQEECDWFPGKTVFGNGAFIEE